jgi:hypothetical protein
VEIEPYRRLKIRHLIDFIPALEPYEHDILVEFASEGSGARMTVTIEPHRDKEWTQRAAQGFESQLTRVPSALARLQRRTERRP